MRQIQIGVTTQDELVRTFGPVKHTRHDCDGRLILGWTHSRVSVTGFKVEALAVIMSNSGKAAGYSLIAGDDVVLFQAPPPPEP